MSNPNPTTTTTTTHTTPNPTATTSTSIITPISIANGLIGSSPEVINFVRGTLERIVEIPTRDKMLRVTDRLFKTHLAYTFYKQRNALLVQHLRGAAMENIVLHRENQILQEKNNILERELKNTMKRITKSSKTKNRRNPPSSPKPFV